MQQCLRAAAFAPGAAQFAAPKRASARQQSGAAVAFRRRAAVAPAPRAAADQFVPSEPVEPEDARGAIAIGLKYSNAGQWEKAQEYFERALELKGTGLKRFRDKPPALSTGELTAALYNIACCRAQLGDVDNGLVAIAGAIEQGYRDFQQLRSDPDLAALRADERFEGLLRRFERKQPEQKGFLGLF